MSKTFRCHHCHQHFSLTDQEWENKQGAAELLAATDALAGVQRRQRMRPWLRCLHCGQSGDPKSMLVSTTTGIEPDEIMGILWGLGATVVLLTAALTPLLSIVQWGLEVGLGWSIGPELLKMPVLRVGGLTLLGTLLGAGLLGVVLNLVAKPPGDGSSVRKGYVGTLMLGAVAQLGCPLVGVAYGILAGFVLGAMTGTAQWLLDYFFGWTLGFSFDWVAGIMLLAPPAAALLAGLIFRRRLWRQRVIEAAVLGLIFGGLAARNGWTDSLLDPQIGIRASAVFGAVTDWTLNSFWQEVVYGGIATAAIGSLAAAAVFTLWVSVAFGDSVDRKVGWILRLLGVTWMAVVLYWVLFFFLAS